MSVDVIIPIRIESTLNLREHWAARAKRSREHRQAVWWNLKAAQAPHTVPCTITLTRIAPRTMDGDNLQAGIKSARDGVADWLQIDDADPRVTWKYGQKRGEPKQYALLVEFA